MLGTELAQFLRGDWRTNSYFVGVYPSDRLPVQRVSWPCCVVINSDPAAEEGEHWVAVYITGGGLGVYFDSYGLYPANQNIQDFLGRNTRLWHWNRQPIQSVLSDKCGYYCLYFLTKSTEGQGLARLLRPFDVLRPFQNDIRVTQWFYRQKKARSQRVSRERRRALAEHPKHGLYRYRR